jgi:hypothetical protein
LAEAGPPDKQCRTRGRENAHAMGVFPIAFVVARMQSARFAGFHRARLSAFEFRAHLRIQRCASSDCDWREQRRAHRFCRRRATIVTKH